MRNSIAAFGLLATIACTSGCGASAEGPSEADVHAAARQQFEQRLAASDVSVEERKAYADALAVATFAPNPQCAKGGSEAYACVLDMTATLPGDAGPTTQPVMVELVKGVTGWKAAPDPG